MSIKSHMIGFLSNTSITTFAKAQHALLPVRNIIIPGYSKSQSRSLWYSLLLYKFKNEHSSCEELWKSAREFILTTLRDNDIREIAETYLRLFSEWKEKDLQSLVVEMSTFYVQLLDIKEAIERTGDENTIAEWKDSYQTLLQKVRNAAVKIKCTEQMDQCIMEIQRAKAQYIYDMMHRAYWDIMEEELQQHGTTILLCHLTELTDIFRSIFPSGHEPLDVSETIAQIQTNAFGFDEAWNIFRSCITLLKIWDSESKEQFYNQILVDMELKRTDSLSQWIRMLMEKSTVLAMDLKTRKALWNILLSTDQNPSNP